MKSDVVLEALRDAHRAGRLRGPTILVGASSGIDSTVLAHALGELRGEVSIQLVVGYVHHGLRPEADEEEDFVHGLAERLGAAFASRRVAPRALREDCSSRARPTLQEAARRLRHAALRELASELGAEQIALAHHADDQAETILLRLMRGCSPDSLAGIAPISGDGQLVRPLLALSRDEIAGYAARQGLAWREDASNGDLGYSRNRLRHRWLPGLAREFNPQLLRAIARLAEAQREDSVWIEAQVAAEAERCFAWCGEVLWLKREQWAGLPEPLAWRLARRAMTEMGAGRDVSRVHLLRFCQFVAHGRPGGELELPAGLRLRGHVGTASLRRVPQEPAC